MAVRTAVKRKSTSKRPKAKAKLRSRTKSRSSSRSAELAKFQEELLAERARLEAELHEIEKRTAQFDESERVNQISASEDHPADLAGTFEREKDLAIGENVESMLHKVMTALEKIDRGTYGTCDACGGTIKKARLRALPFATLCLECQSRLER
jgi:RNA polymerase-binding transcription factor DksA